MFLSYKQINMKDNVVKFYEYNILKFKLNLNLKIEGKWSYLTIRQTVLYFIKWPLT